MTVPVTLSVESSGLFYADLPGGLSFSLATGAKKVTSQNLFVGNAGSGKLKWTLVASTADGGNWLLPVPTAGTAPKTIKVGINPANLPGAGKIAGNYDGQLLFISSGGDTACVLVTVSVSSAGFTQLNPLNFVM